MLLGTYEQDARPWSPEETPWDFGSQLLKPDLDRIAPELAVAFKHYPGDGHDRDQAGRQRPVHVRAGRQPAGRSDPRAARLLGRLRGDGRPVAGRRRRSCARGLDDRRRRRDSGMDIWAMDVARFGDYATLAYTNAKVRENYSRRFRITFPNEELPAARPLRTTPIYDRLTAANAVWGASFGLEHALWFQEAGLEPKEEVTFRRSNAWDCVAGEVAAVRERVGLTEISNYAKYRVTGPGAEAWLSSLLTARMPAARPDRPDGDAQRRRPDRRRVHGRPADRRRRVLPLRLARRPRSTTRAGSPPTCRPTGPSPSMSSGLSLVGLSIAGPHARDMLQRSPPDRTCPARRSGSWTFRRIEVGMVPALVGRINYTRRPRLRAVGRARVPAGPVRPVDGRRRGIRHPAVRVPGADVAAAREELRDVVPRVPPDLHARTRPASAATSSSTTSSSAARRTRRRSRPGPSAGSSRSSSSPIRTSRPTSSATSRSGTTGRSSAG